MRGKPYAWEKTFINIGIKLSHHIILFFILKGYKGKGKFFIEGHKAAEGWILPLHWKVRRLRVGHCTSNPNPKL